MKRADPHEPLQGESVQDGVDPPLCGKPCPACGSTNTMTGVLFRSRPSVLFVIFFGWVFLLIRGAFAMRTEQCRDCGATRRYKSSGSWVALAVLIVLALCVVALVVLENSQP